LIRTRKKTDDEPQNKHHIRVWNIFLCAAMILALLAVVSYSSNDWNSLRGGISAPPANWVGALGAYFSWFLLYACGIAGYILVILMLLRSFRLLLPGAGSFRNFFTGTILITSGAMLLLAINPETFINVTHNLGLGHAASDPAKAIPGGLIGQFFAAPPYDIISAGYLYQWIGKIGTAVVGWIMVISGGVILYISDWHEIVRKILHARGISTAGDISRSILDRIARYQEERAARKLQEYGEEYEEEEENDDLTDNDDDNDDEEDILPEVIETPKKTGKLSRLQALLQSGEEFNSDGGDSPANDSLLPPDEPPPAASIPAAVPVNSSRPAAAPPASAAGIKEIPDVGKKVVQDGEKIRGEHGEFVLPLLSMLAQGTNVIGESSDAIELAKSKIQQTLENFSIPGRVSGHVSGPRVTRYEITLEPGVNVKKVEQIQDNIRMDLAAQSIRVLAPIPGRSVVGIEVSNSKPEAVFMRSIMESDEWKNSKAEIPLALGKNVSGKPVILDLAKAPHMLVAGATGTGKSVCSNSLIVSLLFRFRPDELRLIMVDPKIVEFDAYKKLPHLLTPIINDSAKVPIALRWAANEMDRRYHILASVGVKKLSEFNSRPRPAEPEFDHEGNPIPDKMPLLVIILDELADLMMTEAKKDVETNITRIAQKGRAAGIHIIVATQRPSTNIITGVIKANLPTRLCFQVRSLVDSRVVLDTPGAEKLLGMGDMLVMTSSSMEIERVQGAWVKDDDIKNIVKFVSDQAPQHFNDTVLAETEDSDEEIDEDMEKIDPEDRADIAPLVQRHMLPGDDDTMRRALEVVILDRKASTSYLQRRLKIGYNRAAEIVDQLEERGIVGPPSGSGNKRDILIFDGIDIG